MSRPHVLTRTALATAALVVLTGCAETSESGGGGGGTSVEYGASKEAYQEALADMDDITLQLQSTAPKGSATGSRFEQYAAAVEDYSGGKITFEIAYSNAIATPTEVDEALTDGRLDFGAVMPTLDPSEFPASNALWDLSFVGKQTPVDGLLQWHAAMLKTAFSVDDIQSEYEDKGLKLLVPAFSGGSFFVTCSEPGATESDLQDRTISSQSTVQTAEAEALGMTASSIHYAELFESLERGVIDCAMSTMTVSTLNGIIPNAPYFTYSKETGLAAPGGSFAMSLDRWNELPLAAQQLLYDRLDVFLEATLRGAWDAAAEGVTQISQESGSIAEFDDEVEAALHAENDQVIEATRKSDAVSDADELVDTLLAASTEWEQRVSELGIDGTDTDYLDFPEWYAAADLDLQPYFDELWSTALDSNRPH